MISISEYYEALSAERKSLQASGDIPQFLETPGYSMLLKKYVEPGKTIKDRYVSVAKAVGDVASELYGEYSKSQTWEDVFFDYMWRGWLSPSTPVLANAGTSRGMTVSCHGGAVDDSIHGFYDSLLEGAVLSKNGFGISSYLGGIRPRGSKFSDNGIANGVVPVFENFVEMANQVSQGNNRRGSWAGYLEIDHPDFDELIDLILRDPANRNVGFIFTDDFIERMTRGDQDALRRYKKLLKLRVTLGKGYFWKVDTVNRQQTEPYKRNGLKNKAAQLCNEITLFSDEDHSYSCVLSSVNLAKYDEWKDTDLVFASTVFLDAVCEIFLRQAKGVKGIERVVRYTEKARSLGLGAMGYHDLLQQRSLPFGSEEAYALNKEVFTHLKEGSYWASRFMADIAGEPEWCKGTGMRNTHTLAVAPNMSTALIVGGTSQGIEPFIANAWTQASAAGESMRVNPNLIKIMKKKGVYNQATIDNIIENLGSVQDVDWLTDHEKNVFKTAFEIDQMDIVRQASDRQRVIDQGQSLNLFFKAGADTKYISQVHKEALMDPYIKGLYYLRTQSGIKTSSKGGN